MKKKTIILIATHAISFGAIILCGIKLNRRIRELKTSNEGLSGENKALREENRRICKENSNLNYQLGKAVMRNK